MNFDQVAKRVFRTLDNNAPLILTGMGVAGTIATAIEAARATPKALRAIEIARLNKERDQRPAKGYVKPEHQTPIEFSKLEAFRVAWPYYITATGLGIVTITCTIGSQSINTKRQAALMSGVTIIDTAFREYRDKVSETFGPKGAEKVQDAVAQAQLDRNPVSREVVIMGSGDVLCFDSLSARYFMSDMETLRRAQNDLNARLIHDMYASQNDFYDMIGLPATELGNELGWNTDVMLELRFSTKLADDGRPCISLNYSLAPVRGYYQVG